MSYVSSDSEEFIEIYALHQRFGGLPLQGTYLEQPAVLIDALKVLQAEVDDFHEYEQREKQKADVRKKKHEQRIGARK